MKSKEEKELFDRINQSAFQKEKLLTDLISMNGSIKTEEDLKGWISALNSIMALLLIRAAKKSPQEAIEEIIDTNTKALEQYKKIMEKNQ